MPGRKWSDLSPAYRARLSRHGINAENYGTVSAQAARGHGKTPERPARAERNPDKYREYMAKRNGLVQRIEARKVRLFGDRLFFRASKSHKYALHNPVTEKRPTIAQMQYVLGLTDSAFEDLASRAGYLANHKMTGWELEYAFIFYH